MTILRIFHKLKYPVFILIVIGLAIWLAIVNNLLIEKLKSQGKDYNVGVATVTPENGKDGESAYEIAKRLGFEGSEEEWLLSLVASSKQGESGLNAYQVAVLNGFNGSQSDWLASLKGQPGPVGPAGPSGESVKGDTGNPGTDGATPACYFEVSQCRGADGTNGANGVDGANGQPPSSWRFTYLTTEYECKRTDPFDAANPTYACEPITQESEES
jgi:hypothetical protein